MTVPTVRSRWQVGVVWAALLLTVIGCRTWTAEAVPLPPLNAGSPPVLATITTLPNSFPAHTQSAAPATGAGITAVPPDSLPQSSTPEFAGQALLTASAEPAGCLAADTQSGLSSVNLMLAYADGLLGLPGSFASRRLTETWNFVSHSNQPLVDGWVVALDVSDVQNEYLLQRMLDSLHVAGFAAWLRVGPAQGLHILAVALLDPAVMQSTWGPYVQAYWQTRASLPSGDPFVIQALKLPPCAWMVTGGFAPSPTSDWWPLEAAQPPNLAAAATAYLAEDSAQANRVARQIDWLGWNGIEAANTMCGPLTWAILQSSGTLPADVGGWSRGPETFWLANPRTNGRPWSLFAPDSYSVYHFGTPLGEFDFDSFALYPGDVLYTYSRGDGFDHMLVVTEMDASGGRYTVTNLVQVVPQKQTTIQRVLLYQPDDPAIGIFKNEWRRDRRNGRTGHDGFDVFRWAWLEKDLHQQAVAYTVQPGDSFGRLGESWKTPPEAIARYNHMQTGDVLTVGQVIAIPPNQRP